MLDACYSAVVLRPQDLNRGKGSRTYGEASPGLISEMMNACDLAGKTVVDLGSGIGQVMLPTHLCQHLTLAPCRYA